MKKISIFCGSSFGNDPLFKEQAYSLGQHLAERNIELVYGGAKVGLMGAVADGALSRNGKVIGVLTSFLQGKELAHEGISELIIVESMTERKTLINDLSVGMIALPGGFGTLDELFEILTLAQLGQHKKPIGLLNVNGFYDHLSALLKHMCDQGLLKSENKDMLLISNNIEDLLDKIHNYVAPKLEKWIVKAEVETT